MNFDVGLCCAALLWRGPWHRSAQSTTAGSSQGGGRDKAHAAVHVHAEGAHVRRHDPATARCTLQVKLGSLPRQEDKTWELAAFLISSKAIVHLQLHGG